MTSPKLRTPLSLEWSASDRLRVVAAMLPDLQEDICAGRYSAPGRPNVTSLQHIIGEPAEVLEAYRPLFEAAVATWEARS